MHRARIALVLVTLALAPGCSDSPNPTAPSPPPSPAVASLVIFGDDAVLTGLSTTYAATATLSDGTTRTVAPTWASSNTDVASVDSAGRLDAKTHGAVTLTATHEGRSVSKTVQVVNNYEGSWAGQYVVRMCDWSGGSFNRGWCPSRSSPGATTWPVGLTLSQTDGNLSEITGVLALGWDGGANYGEGSVTGHVTPDGRLNLAGTVNVQNYWDVPGFFLATVQIGAWETRLGGPDVMTGRWAQNFTSVGYTGNAYQEVELVTMTRVSTDAGPASASQTGVRSSGLLSRRSGP